MIRRWWAEIGLATTTVVGYLLIVWGLAELTTVWVWPIGVGAGLLGMAGFKLLWVVVSDGLYVLSGRGSDESDTSGS